MQNRTPTVRPILPFTPVPRKHRVDGWTPERQRAFIVKLAETGSVKAAAQAVNMSAVGAYQLRRMPGAESFNAAWDAAVHHGVQNLADIAMERAVEGVAVPVYWKGEQVGEKRWYNDRLLMFMLRHHLPGKFGDLKRLPPGGAPGHEQALADTRAEAAADPEGEAAAALAEAEEMLNQLMRLYRGKVQAERRYRMEGDILNADWCLRQMTHFELAMELGDAPIGELIEAARENDGEGQRFTSAWSERLHEERLKGWEVAGDPPRPPLHFFERVMSSYTQGGDHEAERSIMRKEAMVMLAEGQALWEATATEEGWNKWLRRE